MPPLSERWRQPLTLSAFLEFPPEQTDTVQQALERCGPADLEALRSIDTLHTLRAFILPAEADLDPGRPPFPPRLVLSLVFDGAAERTLAAVCSVARWLVEALRCCAGFPAEQDLVAWLLQRSLTPDTFHIGVVRHSLATIREEDRLYAALRSFADAQLAAGTWATHTPAEIRAALRAHVAGRAELPQARRPRRAWASRAFEALALLGFVAVFLVPCAVVAALVLPASFGALAGGTLGALGLVVSSVFFAAGVAERREVDEVTKPDPLRVARLLDREDHHPQNQFTMLAPVRDSRFRRLNLALSLYLSNQLSRHLWNRGKLAGVETIHFARIHQLDRGRRMLFMSDFDGGWDRYLFDFLGPGAFAVLPNWTNLHGCPKSRFILWPRPGFAQQFLPFTRARQLETTVWYCAAPHLTVLELKRNAALREGLFAAHLSERALREWLSWL